MVRILSEDDVASVLDLEELLSVVAEAFEKQGEGAVERPERPHYPVGIGRDESDPERPLGTGLCMPAYVHGAAYAVTKLAAVFEGNEARGLPTVNAQIALTDADCGLPVGYLAGTLITNARTGCIGGLAARELAATGPVRLAVFGAGTQARWQTRAVAAATPLESVRVYSPSDSRERCASELDAELEAPVTAVSSPTAALEEATVVVTATTSTEPVFSGAALEPGTLVIAVGAYTPAMRELDAETVERAACVFADVPSEALETGDLREQAVDPIPFAAALSGEAGRRSDEEILVLSSVGSAVLDAAAAAFLFDRARSAGVGTEVSL
ncbi:ornithine cyclodeaminase family protein [Natrononativus amylolyticus]|uniref:ornithine cyclodeaminase family protein n=1 Tax=Natrononativus amylolyticus TaxID=2963434 RepID=UPI0020CD403A|nr:ornithine cyclodeaminase family protein [Natrononativus amylolyticus]